MSKKLFETFECIVNGDTEKAHQLFHEFTVDVSKDIYRKLNESEYDMYEADLDDVSVEGDQTEDFIADIEADEQDIASDELNAGEVDCDTEECAEDEQDEKLEELSSKIDELMSKFQALIDVEKTEPHHADDELEKLDVVDSEDDSEDLEYVKEGYDQVAAPANTEGKLAGTGKNSKTGATQTMAPLSKVPSKTDGGKGQPVKFATGDEKGMKAPAVKDMGVTNEGDYKQVKDTVGEAEGDFVGTGKNTPGAKQVNKHSILSKPVKNQ